MEYQYASFKDDYDVNIDVCLLSNQIAKHHIIYFLIRKAADQWQDI